VPYRLLYLTNPPPNAFPPFAGEAFLFLRPRHLLLQPDRPLHYLALLNESGQAVAHTAFFERDGWAVSPSAASFGSIQCQSDLWEEDLHRFVQALQQWVRKLSLKGIRLVHYPDCYTPEGSALQTILLSHGFRVNYAELNQHRPVTEAPFAAGLHPSERRRLRKCREAGFSAGLWPDPDLDSFYDLLQRARLRNNLPITMAPNRLTELLARFPDECRLFAVWDGQRLIAACVGIRISPDILYYFLPADEAAYLTYSPSVLLVESLYQYAQENGIRLLDLGISTSRGVRNEGLIRFKRNLGARESARRVYEWTPTASGPWPRPRSLPG